MLLLWAPALLPQGQSKIAAIRFAAPVCIECIRVVPHGVAPFLNQPLRLGETRPDSFSINMFLNTYTSGEGQPKSASNVLSNSKLVFTGEMLDHVLDMGPQISTRLLLFQGNFERLSIAIYGQTTATASQELKVSVVPSSLSAPAPIPYTFPPFSSSNPDDPLFLARGMLQWASNQPSSLEVLIQQFGETITSENSEDETMVPSSRSDDSADVTGMAGGTLPLNSLLNTVGISDPSSEPARIGGSVLGVLAVLSWAVEEEEVAVIRYGLLTLKIWQADDSARKVIEKHSILEHGIPLLVRCYQLQDPQVSSSARYLLRNLLSNPKHAYAISEAAAGDGVLGDLLPVSSPSILDIIVHDDADAALRVLQEVGSVESVTFAQAYTMRVALEWLRYQMKAGAGGRSPALESAALRHGQSLTYTLIDALKTSTETIKRGLLPTAPSEISAPLLGQLLAVSSSLSDLISSSIASLPTTSRLGREVTSIASTLYLAASQCKRTHQGEWEMEDAAHACRTAAESLIRLTLKLLQTTGHDASVAIKVLFDTGLEIRTAFRDGMSLVDMEGLIRGIINNAIGGPQESKLLQNLLPILPDLALFFSTLEPEQQTSISLSLIDLDDNQVGLGEWILQKEIQGVESSLNQLAALRSSGMTPEQQLRTQLLRRGIDKSFSFIGLLLDSTESKLVNLYFTTDDDGPSALERSLRRMLEQDITSIAAIELARTLAISKSRKLDRPVMLTVALTLFRSMRIQPPPFTASTVLPTCLELLDVVVDDYPFTTGDLTRLCAELGYALMELSADDGMHEWGDSKTTAQTLVGILELVQKEYLAAHQETDGMETIEQEYGDEVLIPLDGLSEFAFQRLVELADSCMSPGSKTLSSFIGAIQWSDDLPVTLSPPVSWKDPVETTAGTLEEALNAADESSRPVTPPLSTPPTILGMAALSPFTVLRSPTAKVATLTKTYSANDFRTHRTSPNMNTSRPPSMHVDDFQGSPPPAPALAQSPMMQWQY